MKGLAQEIEQEKRTRLADWEGAKGTTPSSALKYEGLETGNRKENKSESLVVLHQLQSSLILSALGDEVSRKILLSSIASGKTVEEISADQHLPLSTCYRRIRGFVDGGLMILEKIVITQTGKKYAVYRTSFSDATIRLSGGEVAVEIRPNADIRDKLFSRWLTTNYPAQNEGICSPHNLGGHHVADGRLHPVLRLSIGQSPPY